MGDGRWIGLMGGGVRERVCVCGGKMGGGKVERCKEEKRASGD